MSNPYPHSAGHPFGDRPNLYPPPKPGTNWKTVAWVLGGIFVFCLIGCSGLAYLGMRGVSNRPPTQAEQQALVTASDLAPFGAAPQRLAQREKWNAKRHLDGALELAYEYDPERAPGGDENLFISSTVEFASSESSARESFTLTKGALGIGLSVGGVTAEDLHQSIVGVDQSHVALLRASGGNPVGNMVIVRQGNRVHGLLIVGIYFESASELEEILRPKLEAAAQVTPR